MTSESIDCRKLQADIDELQKKRDILRKQIAEADEKGAEEMSGRDFTKLANEAEEISERLMKEYEQNFYDAFPELHCNLTPFYGDSTAKVASLSDGNLIVSGKFGVEIMVPYSEGFVAPGDGDNSAERIVDIPRGADVTALPDGRFITVEPGSSVATAVTELQTITIYTRETRDDGSFQYVGKTLGREYSSIESVKMIADDVFLINATDGAKIVDGNYNSLIGQYPHVIKHAVPLPNGGILALSSRQAGALDYLYPSDDGLYEVEEYDVAPPCEIEAELPNGDTITNMWGNIVLIRMTSDGPIPCENPIGSYNPELESKWDYYPLPNGDLVAGSRTQGYSFFHRDEANAAGYEKYDEPFTSFPAAIVAVNDDGTIVVGEGGPDGYDYYLYEPGGESGYVRGDKLPLPKTIQCLEKRAVLGDGRIVVADEKRLSTLRVSGVSGIVKNIRDLIWAVDKTASEDEV